MKNKVKEYYIHVGMPKAASTFLQLEFFPKLDICYIYKTKSNKLNNIIEKSLRDLTKTFHSEVDSIIEEVNIQNSQNFLYSQESLFGMYNYNFNSRISMLKLIQNLFRDPKIILIIRKQMDFIDSAYRNAVQNGYSFTIDRFINESNSYYGLNINNLNWNARVLEYEEIFGEGNVYVLPYELLKKDSKQFLFRLAEILKIDYESIPKQKEQNKKNTSFSNMQINILRVMNKFIDNGTNSFYLYRNNPFKWLGKINNYLHINYLVKLFSFNGKNIVFKTT